MRPTLKIEDVLGTRGRVAVLRCLARVSVPLSIRQVAAQSGMSHPAAAAALDALVDMGVVGATSTGRSRVHWLLRDNLYVETVILPAFEAEAAVPDTMLDILRQSIPPGVVSAVLYGSYARGDQTPGSDIDVLLVTSNSSDVAAVLEFLDAGSSALATRLGAHVNFLAQTREEALALIRSGGNFMTGVVRDGIVLRGGHPRDSGYLEE